jgi:hypothetical protein
MSLISRKPDPARIPAAAREALQLARHKQPPNKLSHTSTDDSKRSVGSPEALLRPPADSLPNLKVSSSTKLPTVSISLPWFSLLWPAEEGPPQELSPASLREHAVSIGWVSLLRPQNTPSNESALAFIAATDDTYRLSRLLHGWLPEALARAKKITRKPRATKKSGPALPTALLTVPTPRHDYLWYRFDQPGSDRFLRLSRSGTKFLPDELKTAEETIASILRDHALVARADDRPKQVASPPAYFKRTVVT